MRLVWAIIPLVLFSVIGIQESFAEKYSQDNVAVLERDDFRITLQTDKSIYYENELILITYTIENLSLFEINYFKTNGCDDGISGYITNNTETIRFSSFKHGGIYLIPKNDHIASKFDSGLYPKILFMIKNNEFRNYDLILFGDKEMIADVLQRSHNITKIYVAKNLSFVTASIPIEEIPDIAKYDFIQKIGDAEGRVCTSDISRGSLYAGDKSEVSWNLSKHYYQYPTEGILSEGEYEIKLDFSLLNEPFYSDKPASPNYNDIELITLKLPIEKSEEWFDETYPEYSSIYQAVGLTEPIPDWVRGVFNFWAEGQISDDELKSAIKFLVNNGVIKLD